MTTTPQQIPAIDGLPARSAKAMASSAYGSSSGEARQERQILENLPLVRHIVQKVTGQLAYVTDLDELISAGTLGLVKAARAFDPTKDADFRTYAYIRIRGAVIDELRGRSFLPPTAHRKVRQIQLACRRFAATHCRPPSDEELAAELGLPPQELYAAMEDARRQHFMCIHGLSEDKPVLETLVPPDRGPAPQASMERREMVERLKHAISRLPQRERQILMLYYERDLTMKEVAAVFKLTESRVSQLHAAAVVKLSALLGRDGDGGSQE